MAFLRERQVPFTEKDVTADAGAMRELLRRTGGVRATPVVVIGERVIQGFDRAQMTQALQGAGLGPGWGAALASPPGPSSTAKRVGFRLLMASIDGDRIRTVSVRRSQRAPRGPISAAEGENTWWGGRRRVGGARREKHQGSLCPTGCA